jgi:TetR/AcrR family transcriptional regulator, cholesterol catabolism regulator
MKKTPSSAKPRAVRPAPETPLAYEKNHVELLEAAAALFAQSGFHNASVRDLSRATGRSLSGLYYYFRTKEELLFQIQHHCYGTLLASAREAIAGATSPRERLITFIHHHLAYFRHNMNEMKVLAHEDLTLVGEYGERILALKREYSRVLIDIVADLEAELPRRAHRPTPEITAFLLFGAMNWLYTWPRRLRQLPAEDLADAIARIFLEGYPEAFGAPGRRERYVAHAFWGESLLLDKPTRKENS